jgi:MOSC domain-containing protein YiiM
VTEAQIVQVSTSRGGVPKRAIAEGRVTVNGIEGDSWAHPEIHGGPLQRVLLIAEEALDELKLAGFPVFAGALGENLTTRGIDPRAWRAGQVWRAGTARLELTKPRAPCSTLKIYGEAIGLAVYDAQVKAEDHRSPVWGYAGFYARVLSEGVVRAGDSISLERETA